MSMIPMLFDNSSRLLDQHFGHGLHAEDVLTSWAAPPLRTRDYYRPWRNLASTTSLQNSSSRITVDKNKFQVCLDVQQFAPDEIVVKTVGRQVVVEGRHEEKEDEHGFVSRHFVRKYILPEGYKPEDVTSTLSSDGILNVTALREDPAVENGERMVPITATGPAHKNIMKTT